MILYRPVSLQELELIYDGGMKAFPTRLPQQPIFYPVLHLEYARQIASDWNARNGQLAGYVTEFKVEDQYVRQFEEHTAGKSEYQELWIPAEEVGEFNKHIIGHIKVLEAHFGDAFRGFVPDKFALAGKNAVEQFTLLTNSYIYNRMDFYLEIKRNHKAVFLNYPFWQKYDFENPKLKEKMLQAIKEAWFTSFPKIPLPLSAAVQQDTPPVKESDSQAEHLDDPVQEDITPVEQTDPVSLLNPVQEDITSAAHTDSYSLANPVREDPAPVRHTDSHFVLGIKLGLSGKYGEAIDALSKAAEENPKHVVAMTSLGVALHRLGDDDRALVSYETALTIDPIHAEAHYFRANILYGLGNVREAIAAYTIAMGLKPELIEAHQQPSPQDRLTDYTHSPAEMYWIAKPAHRILDLNKRLESNPGQANLFKERAAAYYRLGNYAQTIADCSSCLAIRPDDGGALHFRGLAYERLGQFERALEDYQRAIAINPQLSNIYISRGITFGKLGNFRQSLDSLTEGIRLAPKNPDGYFNRGMTYFQQGDFESAVADFSMVIQLSSNDQDAYYWRGISNEEAGRQQAAIADYKQFLAIAQDSRVREEIEQRLSRWHVDSGGRASHPNAASDDNKKTSQVLSKRQDPELDLYALILALGERALHSKWFGAGVDCYGKNAEELYAFANRNKPIEGHNLLHIVSGIRHTTKGDFQAFDPDAGSHWIFIRAWNGTGFYIETNDPKIKGQLKAHFRFAEEVEGANPPYEGLFIPNGVIDSLTA